MSAHIRMIDNNTMAAMGVRYLLEAMQPQPLVPYNDVFIMSSELLLTL